MRPPSGRVRCLQAMMVEIEATPLPEALQHTMSTSQDRVNIMFEYRGMLVDVLGKLILSTWRCCARQLYVAVDPVRFIGVVGVPGSIAGTPFGLSDQFETDKGLMHTIDTRPLAQWPSWYMAQYDALIIQPL